MNRESVQVMYGEMLGGLDLLRGADQVTPSSPDDRRRIRRDRAASGDALDS
jgi:hypothetical protein